MTTKPHLKRPLNRGISTEIYTAFSPMTHSQTPTLFPSLEAVKVGQTQKTPIISRRVQYLCSSRLSLGPVLWKLVYPAFHTHRRRSSSIFLRSIRGNARAFISGTKPGKSGCEVYEDVKNGVLQVCLYRRPPPPHSPIT